jgi:hypothetical protein
MRKTLTYLAFIAVYIINAIVFHVPVEAASADELMKQANQEIESKYGIPDFYYVTNNYGNAFNQSTFNRMQAMGRTIFPYGSPAGGDGPNGPRVFGQTMLGDVFTNARYPDDAYNASLPIISRNWLEEPWHEPLCLTNTRIGNLWTNRKKNRFDGNPAFEDAIARGMELRFPGNFSASQPSKYSGKWHQYVKILQPPTSRSDGVGLMFHKAGTTVWYATISLPATATAPKCPEETFIEKIKVNGKDPKENECAPVTPGKTAEIEIIFSATSTTGNKTVEAWYEIASSPRLDVLTTQGAISIPIEKGKGQMSVKFTVNIPADLKAGAKIKIEPDWALFYCSKNSWMISRTALTTLSGAFSSNTKLRDE